MTSTQPQEVAENGDRDEEVGKNVSDDTEHQLGISVYLSPDNAGFSAVLKARYSDFVVHEVGHDGKVARLESLSPEIASEAASNSQGDEKTTDPNDSIRKRKREEADDAAVEEKTKEPPAWEDLQSDFAKIVGEESAQKVIQFLKDDFAKEGLAKNEDKDSENNQQYYVALPPIDDKETRKKIHQWTKSSALALLATADTGDDTDGNKVIRFWPLRYEKKMPNHGQFDRNGRRIPKQGHRGKDKKPSGYLRFVLYKENCDTNTAIKQITKRMSAGRGGRGGRGRGGRHSRNDRVRVGYAGMKDKRGVTTQFMTLHQRSPNEITWVNQNKPNHYGGGNSSSGGHAIIRVGNFTEVNEELRLGRLKGNRFDVVLRNVQTSEDHSLETTKDLVSRSADALKKHGFINYFGTQRFGKFHDTHLAGMAFLKGDFEKVVEIIMRPKEGERDDVLEARKKWKNRFDNLNGGDTRDARAKAEADCARLVLKSMGRFMANEVSVLESLSRQPLDYKRAFSFINKTMRMMFMHAVQSLLWNRVASYRIKKMASEVAVGDLVFVDKNAEENENAAVKHVTQEDVDAKKYTLEDVILPLLGTKSLKPENESGKLFDPFLEEYGLTADVFKNIQDRDISCPGDYRKLICRPSDVDYSLVKYRDPYQPLLQTDLMKINGIPVLEDVSQDGEKVDKPLLGLVVGFTLPASAYATIALRELMKKPTSSEYQKELGLGVCATSS